MCATELDRERLVGTVNGVGRARVVMFVVLLAVLIGAVHETGWWPLLTLLVAAAVSIYLYRDVARRRHPEYWAAAGWLSTQIPLGIGIAITGGPRSPALSWLAIAVVSLVARFNRVTIRAGMAFLYLLLLLDTFGVDASWTVNHPATTLAVGGLMFSVWLFAEALMRSDLDHRTRDGATGLSNQAKFLADLRLTLARRAERGGAVSVLVVSLEGLDVARESLGPHAINGLLSQVGARIARAGAGADLVARGSGDEFLLLISDLGDPSPGGSSRPGSTLEQGARAVAEAVQTAVTEPITVGKEEVCLNSCVGIAILGPSEQLADLDNGADKLLADAQLALSSARHAGPGGVAVYDPSQPRAERRLSLVSRLRRAIDQGDLTLHYQPTVDVRNGRILGVEALARWEDEQLGTVPPAEFISVAEETGLIEALGVWVMEEVARQAREWESQEMRFEVAFNLSPRQLWHPELLPRLRTILDASGVPRERFIVEITESSALRDFDSTVALLSKLRADGYRIAIDDFGVELSSLSRLLDIPSDILKIDRSFVRALSTHPNAGVMVKTIIDLADRLGMRSHAEGVETEVERRFLVANGCELAQGYLFSHPLPATEIRKRYLDSLYRWPVRLHGGSPRAA